MLLLVCCFCLYKTIVTFLILPKSLQKKRKKKEKKKKKKDYSNLFDLGPESLCPTGVTQFLNPFIPEFLKWMLPSLNLGMSITTIRVLTVVKKKKKKKTDTEWQTVQIQMRWLIMSHLIWICTVCKCTSFGLLGCQAATSLTLCMLGNFACVFGAVDFFFFLELTFSKKSFRNTIRVSNSLDLDQT